MIDLSQCRHQRVHELFKEALKTDPKGFVEGKVIELRDWSTALQVHYRIHLQLGGDCWVQIGQQRWPLKLIGRDRYAYPNGRYVRRRSVFRPQALRLKGGAATYIIGQDGRSYIELLRTPDSGRRIMGGDAGLGRPAP